MRLILARGETAGAATYGGEMSLKKELREILREARRQGWRVERTRGGHYMLYAPDGKNIVVAASTPGKQSSIRETLAEMRSYGFKWKGR
jgi:predicted RNA binding protein YcfA (HicA-like mRNA interferase family)